MIRMTVIAAFLAAGLGLLHIFIGRLGFLGRLPRSIWLSAAGGGVAVAYFFLNILPKLGAHQATFSRGLELGAQAAESWIFL
ncbi:hypothetical protein D516_1360 [Rhodobacter sp. AKP1]|nr:hypothetical protein D516_1360 [Rhodobacter sp. AKP1]